MSKEEELKPCVIDDDFIDLAQYIYLCNFVFVYIDNTYGNMLDDKEVTVIYKTCANRAREYASFINYKNMLEYIKNKCESDNTIKHLRFRIGNAVFCIAKREEV